VAWRDVRASGESVRTTVTRSRTASVSDPEEAVVMLSASIAVSTILLSGLPSEAPPRPAAGNASATSVQSARDSAPQDRQEPANRVAGSGDGWITAKIQVRFLGDPLLTGNAIQVETLGGVVTLSGSVAQDAVRKRALTLARGTDGVKQVVDRLAVAGADRAHRDTGSRDEASQRGAQQAALAAENVSDAWIAAKVRSRFIGVPSLFGSALTVSAHAGEVTLSGSVASEEGRLQAENLAREVRGVKRVQNLVTVGSS
jgi:osmotically-inducible protein OsmY